jgi:hypothetical protein
MKTPNKLSATLSWLALILISAIMLSACSESPLSGIEEVYAVAGEVTSQNVNQYNIHVWDPHPIIVEHGTNLGGLTFIRVTTDQELEVGEAYKFVMGYKPGSGMYVIGSFEKI